MKLIVGLGNVGTRYQHTRHNAGFMVVDEIVRMQGASWRSEAKLKAEIARFEVEDETILLAKPTTMMNASGEAVQRIMQLYKLVPKDIYVVFDDVDTPFGRMKLRQGGGSSGHQGINSTIASVGPNFVRVKFGISLNDRAVEPSEIYVLKPFNDEEHSELPRLIEAAARKIVGLVVDAQTVAASFHLIDQATTEGPSVS